MHSASFSFIAIVCSLTILFQTYLYYSSMKVVQLDWLILCSGVIVKGHSIARMRSWGILLSTVLCNFFRKLKVSLGWCRVCMQILLWKWFRCKILADFACIYQSSHSISHYHIYKDSIHSTIPVKTLSYTRGTFPFSLHQEDIREQSNIISCLW